MQQEESPLATANVKQDQIRIYPNPVKDILNIDLKSDKGSVKIFDLTGKVVKTADLNKSGTIDVSQLTKGMYLVEIILNGNAKVTKKIIKE